MVLEVTRLTKMLKPRPHVKESPGWAWWHRYHKLGQDAISKYKAKGAVKLYPEPQPHLMSLKVYKFLEDFSLLVPPGAMTSLLGVVNYRSQTHPKEKDCVYYAFPLRFSHKQDPRLNA